MTMTTTRRRRNSIYTERGDNQVNNRRENGNAHRRMTTMATTHM
jgi:hypothetical protein